MKLIQLRNSEVTGHVSRTLELGGISPMLLLNPLLGFITQIQATTSKKSESRG